MVSVGLVTTGNCTSEIFGLKCFFTDFTDFLKPLSIGPSHGDPESLNSALSAGRDRDNSGEVSEDGGLGKSGLPEYIVVWTREGRVCWVAVVKTGGYWSSSKKRDV